VSDSVTRRSALTAAAVAVAGAIAGFVWGRNSDAAKSTAPASAGGGYGSSSGRLLVPLANVPDGGGVIRSGVVVTRAGSSVHAFSARCTHLGCTVNAVKQGKIFCPCHGSVFDANTGAVLQSPATAPLARVGVTVKDGGVYTS
jgi:Rieske Fe-S protein